MAGGPRQWTEDVIAKRFEEGRGQGSRETYQPWIRVQEFSSTGNQTRVPSLVVNRTIHTFSYIERAMYLYLEYSGGVFDYREQFPMDRQVTLGAAKALRIRHPRYPKSSVPLVMMLDALVTYRDANGGERLVGWDAKPSDKMQKRRIREKLSLHRAFCAHAGIEHNVFTERTVSPAMVRNIDLVRMAMPRPNEVLKDERLFGALSEELLKRVVADSRRLPIWRFCKEFDTDFRLEFGSALRAFYSLVWNRRVSVDMAVEQLQDTLVANVKEGKGRTPL